ncbi:hypothetical protein GCM10009789_38380 [Kribbella sancticallisti]|uniref:Methyltransferase domain-containing protein n=1 Tax=Kribbella sancticallisti TaxID=460087 RepID=A0ABN2DMR6_9ACTN
MRVVRPGGIVAFDIVTEDCVDDTVLKSWIAQNLTLYLLTPRSWTIELLQRRGLTLIGSHHAPLSGGSTSCWLSGGSRRGGRRSSVISPPTADLCAGGDLHLGRAQAPGALQEGDHRRAEYAERHQ